MRIIVIEDEAKTAKFLKKGLTEAGFVVDVASDGRDGFELARTLEFDLVILDVMLPGMDGWQVLTALRSAGTATQVLLLTARDAVHERVRGFELGADDYLVKPFALSELLARVRSRLRRTPARPQNVVRMADLEIDMLRHRATRNGQRATGNGQRATLGSDYQGIPPAIAARSPCRGSPLSYRDRRGRVGHELR